MARYLARQIQKGKLEYEEVILKFPNLKDEIDAELEILQGGE